MNNQQQDFMPAVTIILAIAAAVFPILFGFLLWKLSMIFVTNRQFEEYKRTIDSKQIEIQLRLSGIDNKLIELLERTASQRRTHKSE